MHLDQLNYNNSGIYCLFLSADCWIIIPLCYQDLQILAELAKQGKNIFLKTSEHTQDSKEEIYISNALLLRSIDGDIENKCSNIKIHEKGLKGMPLIVDSKSKLLSLFLL